MERARKRKNSKYDEESQIMFHICKKNELSLDKKELSGLID